MKQRKSHDACVSFRHVAGFYTARNVARWSTGRGRLPRFRGPKWPLHVSIDLSFHRFQVSRKMVSGKEESVFDKGKWKEYSYTFYINLAIPLRRVFISINLSDGLQVFETCPLTRKISSLILYVASPSRKGEDNDIILENSIRSVLSEFSFGERRVGNFLNSSAGSLCATGWIFDEVRRGSFALLCYPCFFSFLFSFFNLFARDYSNQFGEKLFETSFRAR